MIVDSGTLSSRKGVVRGSQRDVKITGRLRRLSKERVSESEKDTTRRNLRHECSEMSTVDSLPEVQSNSDPALVRLIPIAMENDQMGKE